MCIWRDEKMLTIDSQKKLSTLPPYHVRFQLHKNASNYLFFFSSQALESR